MKTDFHNKAPRVPAKFKPEPFAYHEEIEAEISSLTNLGEGVARLDGWVVFIAGALPRERVRARVWHNAKNFSRADLVSVILPSPDRVEARCPLFGTCGGCQYQNLKYSAQLDWKTRQISELLERLGKISFPVNPCHGSPKIYGYRSKITPHFERPRANENDFPIGFLAAGTSRCLVDISTCPIATDGINAELPALRECVRKRAKAGEFRKGATLLVRETREGIVSDPKAPVSECVGELTLKFVAGDFFQNNPFILPEFVSYAINAARGNGDCNFFVDAYCGSGLFALSGAPFFEKTLGVEVGEDAVKKAKENALANGLSARCDFVAGSAETIFAHVAFPSEKTALLIDPPRRGCDEAFLSQLLAFAPKRVVYVSCGPDTQARDLRILLDSGAYALESVQPFDLFPQTRHIENIAVLARK